MERSKKRTMANDKRWKVVSTLVRYDNMLSPQMIGSIKFNGIDWWLPVAWKQKKTS